MAKKRSTGKHNWSPDNLAIEWLKDIAGWVLVTGIAFVYWLVMLLFASLVLLSYWKVTFESLLRYSVVLTVISSILYLIYMIRRRVRENRIARYMAE